MEAVVYIYIKDNEIKVLDSSFNKDEHDSLLKDNWKHTVTLNTTTFIKYVYENTIDDNIKQILNGK